MRIIISFNFNDGKNNSLNVWIHNYTTSVGLSKERQNYMMENILAFFSETLLPTKYGIYNVKIYQSETTEIPVIIYGGLGETTNVPLRIHDACFTGEVLHSLKCDCADQLDFSLKYIRDVSGGIIIYMPQEGRGIGLGNKIKVYNIQETGVDTVDANLAVGLPVDNRNYDVIPTILKTLGIKSVKLISNNPKKFDDLKKLGVEIVGRIPAWVSDTTNNNYLQTYINTKKTKMNHLV